MRTKRDDHGKYLILMDPKGFYDGRKAMVAGVRRSLRQAMERVDRLSQWLEIRFMAAKLVGWIDTH